MKIPHFQLGGSCLGRLKNHFHEAPRPGFTSFTNAVEVHGLVLERPPNKVTSFPMEILNAENAERKLWFFQTCFCWGLFQLVWRLEPFSFYLLIFFLWMGIISRKFTQTDPSVIWQLIYPAFAEKFHQCAILYALQGNNFFPFRYSKKSQQQNWDGPLDMLHMFTNFYIFSKSSTSIKCSLQWVNLFHAETEL